MGVQRGAGGCVAHTCLHGLDVRAGCDQKRREVVAQIVEAELLGQAVDSDVICLSKAALPSLSTRKADELLTYLKTKDAGNSPRPH